MKKWPYTWNNFTINNRLMSYKSGSISRETQFFFRGGDPLKEDEYIEDSVVKLGSRMREVENELEDALEEYEMVLETISSDKNFLINMDGSGEPETNIVLHINGLQETLRTAQERLDFYHKMSENHNIRSMKKQLSDYKSEIEEDNDNLVEYRQKILKGRREISEIMLSEKYMGFCDAESEKNVAKNCIEYLSKIRRLIVNKLNSQTSKEKRLFLNNTHEFVEIYNLTSSLIEYYLAKKESDLQKHLCNIHYDTVISSEVDKIEKFNYLLRLYGKDVEEIDPMYYEVFNRPIPSPTLSPLQRK